MTRIPPPELDWTWEQFVTYKAELVLELYIQGRSFDEVTDVTGWPGDDVRELARAVGVERSPWKECEVSAWRKASRAMLAFACVPAAP